MDIICRQQKFFLPQVTFCEVPQSVPAKFDQSTMTTESMSGISRLEISPLVATCFIEHHSVIFVQGNI